MRRIANIIIATALVIGYSANASAQEKKWEHMAYLSVGQFIDADSQDGTAKGLTIKRGYGLNRYFTENISLMAGIAYHSDEGKEFPDATVGADDDYFRFIEFPIMFQYHYEVGSFGKLVFGIGPAIDYCIHNDYYTVADDPYSPFNHKKKIKQYNFSIIPSISYQFWHFRIGVDGSYGIPDVKLRHGITFGSKHLHNICATVALVL